MSQDQKKCESDLLEKSNLGKNEIKERFNLLAQQVKIDAKALVEALLTSNNQGKSDFLLVMIYYEST